MAQDPRAVATVVAWLRDPADAKAPGGGGAQSRRQQAAIIDWLGMLR